MGLKKYFGKWFKPPAAPVDREVASVGLQDRWSSYPSIGLTPGGLAAIFQEADQGAVRRQMELFEEMEEKDAHLAALLQTRKLAVLSLDYEILPHAKTPEDEDIAGAMGEMVWGIPNLEGAFLDLLDAIGKGFALTEIHWQVEKGRVGVAELSWIPQKKTTFASDLKPRLLTADGPWEGVEPPPWKIIYHRYKARSGHDTRAGVLRVVGYMYLLKNYALKDWTAFNEVFGMPLRLGKYDPAATPADREALIQAIRNLGTDAAGIISKNTEIEFVETASRLSGNVQGRGGADPDHGYGRGDGDLCGGPGACPGAAGFGGGGRPGSGADPQGAVAAAPGGLQLRLGQGGALVPLPLRGGGGPEDPVRGLPEFGGFGGALESGACGGTLRHSPGPGGPGDHKERQRRMKRPGRKTMAARNPGRQGKRQWTKKCG